MVNAKLKLAPLLHLSANVDGQRVALSRQVDELKKEVGEAKAREAKQPTVVDALEQLQRNEHERSVGVFSRLLSALAKDVLPHATKPVVLDLYTAHGSPALDIDIAASAKHKEEITSGAIKNVLSVGLRLIAIARTKQRRFLVLDEPDHWIRPENVPQFVSVLDRIIRELGFQILMISHHPASYFSQVAKCVTLVKEGDTLTVSGDLVPAPHDGLQAVRLVNFEAHHDTLIPLHAGMTVLTGENGLGKSSFVRGLKALLEAEAHKDRVILHTPKEAPYCRVEVQLDSKEWVGWRRVRKLNATMRHKNRFYVRADDIDASREDLFLMAQDTADDIPDFIQERTNIRPDDRWNIHVAGQEESVFLLGKETKPTERAKILALGNEAEVLHAMIERNRLESRKDKEVVREGEKRLGAYTRRLSETEVFEKTTKSALERLVVVADNLDDQHEKAASGRVFANVFATHKTKALGYKTQAALMSMLPMPPNLHDVDALKELSKGVAWVQRWSQVTLPKQAPDEPLLRDVSGLNALVQRLKAPSTQVPETKLPDPPVLMPVAEVSGWLKDVGSKRAQAQQMESAKQEAARALRSLERELEEVWAATPQCPLCGSNVIHQHPA
jgi:ABC-type branched-subunit amino acid transport system ATPase component